MLDVYSTIIQKMNTKKITNTHKYMEQKLRETKLGFMCLSPFLPQASPVAQLVKNPPAMWETWVWSLGWEDPLQKGKATCSSILAWRIPYSSWGRKELDLTEWLLLLLSVHFPLSCPYLLDLTLHGGGGGCQGWEECTISQPHLDWDRSLLE